MQLFNFYKLSPSGNSTLFLISSLKDSKTIARLCARAINGNYICAEQCGMADLPERTVRMGGGEFCANACRAFGALLASLEGGSGHWHYEMHISGYPLPVGLEVSGALPVWQVNAIFQIPEIDFQFLENGLILARLPGISHLLIPGEFPGLDSLTEQKAAKLRQKYGLDSGEANGLVWWRELDDGFELFPFVQVPQSATAMLESACGSASIALALAQNTSHCHIRQTGGEIITVQNSAGKICLGGEVRFCAEGRLYLNADE